MAESFVFYKSFGNALKKIPAESYKECMQALIDYAIDGVEPESDDPFVSMFFELARPQVDANERRREAGGKGGQANRSKGEASAKQNEASAKQTEANVKQNEANRKQTEAKPKQNEASAKQTEANVNVNANANVNDKDNNPPTPFTVTGISQEELEDLGCAPEVAEKLSGWIENKDTRKEPVTEMELKSIVSRAKACTAKHGAAAVATVIEDSLSYKAIIWDKLEHKTRDKPKPWQVSQRQDYAVDELEARLLAN